MANSSLAYSQEMDNVIGKKFSLSSTILAEKRDIQIHFPQSYDSSKNEYPVLYILDGQRLHTLGVSLSQSFRSTVKISPEFIVVSINNKYPDRFEHFTKPAFLTFIEKELIPYVDTHYRTTTERILFGWEFAGAYVIESLINKPELFSGHIATSPYPVHETWFEDQTKIEQLEKKLKQGLKSHLYFTVSEGESVVEIGTDALNLLLEDKAPDSLRWTYRVIPDEQHLSTAHASMFQGLRNYFYGYETFQIYSLDKFDNAGGLKNFYAYNKLRAERFGFSEDPEPWSMFTIVRNAIRADKFDRFESFINEFKLFNMLSIIEQRNANEIAQFYVKHKAYKKAIEVYEIGVKNTPEDANIHNKLGDVYLALADKKTAKLYYEKSVKLAKKSNDKRLAEFQKDLDGV